MTDDAKMIMILDLLERVTKLEKEIYNSKTFECKYFEDCDALITRNEELDKENEELYEENKRLREILEYGKIDCKHLISFREGDYCMKTGDWFFDFEGYEDDCPTCKYYERR